MISLNPGPSQLSAETVADIADIAASGLLSKSHRSDAFVEVSRAAFGGLREKLAIPADYKVLYQPSATAAMDTLLRNCVRARSYHFVHGAFSKRFRTSAKEIGLDALVVTSDGHRRVPWREKAIPAIAELVAVTHNETATGLMWPADQLAELRAEHPDPLIAVDVTSSFGGVAMRWTDADVWFGSVQKCLGLPSGMGYLVVGPRAMEAAKRIDARVSAWQSFASMAEKMDAWQTVETPNVLAIALLARQMKRWDLARIERETREKAALLYGASLPWTPYVEDAAWRSPTVACFRVDEPKRWIEKAAAAGFALGSGYSELKPTTVRVANFPAVSADVMRRLLAALGS
jgi:phosphoserine aminotransferase